MKKLITAALVLLAGTAAAGLFPYPTPAVDEAGLTADKSYVFNAGPSFSNVTASVQYSSVTFGTQILTSGQIAVGSLVIPENVTQLTEARASNYLTVNSTSGLKSAKVTLLGYQLQNQRDWLSTSSKATTAASIATALSRLPMLSVSRVGDVIYTTASAPGLAGNSLKIYSSTPAALTMATTYLTGGRDNAVFTLSGVPFRQGYDWAVGADSAAAAVSLAYAINNSRLSPYLTATANSPTNGVVSFASKMVGSNMNYTMTSSLPAALVPSGPTMTGGVNASYALGSSRISLASHGLTLGTSVMFTLGTLAVSPLVDQTTYYAAPLGVNAFALATTPARASAGLYVTLTSSLTLTTALTSTLVPLPITGTPGFYWESSNNKTSWTDLTPTVSSVTITSYTAPYATKSFSFGHYAFKYARFRVVAPASGAVKIKMSLVRQ